METVSFARSQFPAIEKSDGTFAFMDNAGGSAVLESVGDRIRDYILGSNVQLGASYPTSQLSTTLVREATLAGTRFVNAGSPKEVVLGNSTTQLMENLARAMEAKVEEGAEIIISDTDHEANCGPWVRLAKRKNLALKIWKNEGPDQTLSLDALKQLLTPNTRLVAVTHCSNILGTVNDVKAIASLVHSVPGAELCVDGVAYAPHFAIDVQDLDIDYYCFSWYKVFGPHISQLYTASRTFPRLTSLAHFFIHEHDKPYWLQPGNVNYELSASIPAVLGYIGDLGRSASERLGIAGQKLVRGAEGVSREDIERGYQRIAEQELTLTTKLLSYLNSKPSIYTVLGAKTATSSGTRVPTIAFRVSHIKSEDFVTKVDGYGLGIRFGHFYAYRLIVDSLGLSEEDGIVRVSLVHYNTVEEVERLVAAFEEVLKTMVESEGTGPVA
ncbi:cysteine desulfurase family protein, VC1184 subfamily [Chytriomyces sp. MP71]|nr:cysteine desulfurase family protein, VC1184 subfamily [Chytriomyces sp. MP71]